MAGKTSSAGFSAEEKAAMKQRAAELKAQAKGAKGEEDVLAAIRKLEGTDHVLATKIHELVRTHAPHLGPKTFYGFPAYANEKGKVVIFYQPASKFKTRYGTLNFDEPAQLDDGPMWATSFAVLEITPDVEARIVELIKRAAPAPAA